MRQNNFKFGLTIILILIAIVPVWGVKAKKKTADPEEVLRQGREAFLNYDFENAADLFDEYRSLQKKSKKDVSEEFEAWEKEMDIASGAFERVQKIVVIDSISVPASTFYKNYKLSKSSGDLGTLTDLAQSAPLKTEEVGFSNEERDYFIIPVENKDGELRLTEIYRLLDGTWEINETLQGDFDKTGDYFYPFMSGDGQTLYFANDGEESMGGLDIFVAQRDPSTGEYLQPLNVGMPFNSPYDDMMMALDEENGIGWWATDRDRNDGNVTVYVYLIEDIRKNYNEDTENLVNLAKLTDYKTTWEEGKEEDYKQKQRIYKVN